MKDEEYMKGFNASYLLSKYTPELLTELLSSIKGKDGYEAGFIDGREQYNIELEQKELNDIHAFREENDMEDRDIDLDR